MLKYSKITVNIYQKLTGTSPQVPIHAVASVFQVFPPIFSESFSPAINEYKILVVNLHFETSAIIFYQQNQGIVSTPVD